MPIIFADAAGKENRGRVIVLEQPGAAAGSILDVEGWTGFGEMKSIITRLQIAESGNYQFLHTLGDRIYVYVFGDRIGELAISGLSFYDNCWAMGGSEKIGVTKVIDYYRDHRLAKRAAPLKVTLDGETTFEAFLIRLSGDVLNTAQRLWQFNLSMALLPSED